MKTHCRCRHCQTRQVLQRHPEAYQRQPRCRSCGARDFRSDRWMNERKNKPRTCCCDGYHFPHRVSSGACKFTTDGEYKQ